MSKTKKIKMIDKNLLEILACSKCKSDLEYKNDVLICIGCKLKYKIDGGIPIMLINEAEQIK